MTRIIRIFIREGDRIAPMPPPLDGKATRTLLGPLVVRPRSW